jgi:hypothetical protein
VNQLVATLNVQQLRGANRPVLHILMRDGRVTEFKTATTPSSTPARTTPTPTRQVRLEAGNGCDLPIGDASLLPRACDRVSIPGLERGDPGRHDAGRQLDVTGLVRRDLSACCKAVDLLLYLVVVGNGASCFQEGSRWSGDHGRKWTATHNESSSGETCSALH